MGLRILPVNYFDEATITVTPAAVSSLPVTNLQSNVSDRLWRSPNADYQVITGHWNGNLRPFSSWGLWGGPYGLLGWQAQVEAFTDLALATRVYNSGVLEGFPFSGTGWGSFAYGGHPWGVDPADRTSRLAPLVRHFAEVTIAAFRITVRSGGALDVPFLEAERFWMAKDVLAPRNARFGAAPQWRSNSEHQRPPSGSLRRLARTRWRECRFDIVLTSEADRAAWADLVYACDPGNEIVASLFAGEGTKRERDFLVKGSLEVLNPEVFQEKDVHVIHFAIVES